MFPFYHMKQQIYHRAQQEGASRSITPKTLIEDTKTYSEKEYRTLLASIQKGEKAYIVLNHCKITDHQLVEIVKAATGAPSTIKEIDLKNNLLTDNAIIALTSVLSNDTNICELTLDNNFFTSNVIRYFLKILEKNFTLVNIRVHNREFDQAMHKDLELPLKRNKEIREALGKQDWYNRACDTLLDEVMLPMEICKMILDYNNEATIIEAREQIASRCYPKLLPKSGGL